MNQGFTRSNWAWLGLLAVAFFGAAAGASKLHPNAERLKNAPNPRMAITRYVGHPGFSSQQSLSWEKRGDKYFAGNVLHTNIRVNDCESHLATQQKFPLFKMVATQYLRKEDVPFYLRLGDQLQPEQVNFLQATRDLPSAEARRMFGRDYEHRRVDILSDYRSDHDAIVTATMWTVAGQALDAPRGQIPFTTLPWQRDPARRELARNFDRSKYKYVWELGRVAQDLPREAEPLASAASAIMYQELAALGGHLADAYVMFHSLDEVNTRAYAMRFPNTLYPKDWTNKNDALFLVPLRDVLKAFPPSLHSGKIAGVIEHSQGVLNETSALNFLNSFHRARYTQLDLMNEPRFFPLALNDPSIGAAAKRNLIFWENGLASASQKFLNHVMSMEGLTPTWNSGQYPDLADIQVSTHFFHQNNAVEISNLNLRLAKLDPLYIETVLMAAYAFYLRSMMPDENNPEDLKRAAIFLRDRDVKFGFTTFEPELAARIRKLNPVKSYRYDYDFSQAPSPEMEGMEWMGKAAKTPPESFLFTGRQIVELINRFPDRYVDASTLAKENIWARHHMLAHPDIF